MTAEEWIEAAESLARMLGQERLHHQVRAFIDGEAGDQPWAIACSGGADSVLLTLALYGLYPEQRDKLHLLHFNHKLRGEASDDDEAFVRELAACLGLPFHTRSWERDAETKVSEKTARDARFSAFEEILEEIDCRYLFLGHHADDAVETLLMRIARGSGVEGLAAPGPVSSFADGHYRIRPLITLRKSEILDLLNQRSVPWREDESNASADFTRNRLRNEVMAALNDVLPGFADGAAYTREQLSEIGYEFRHHYQTLPQDESRLDLTSLDDKREATVRFCLDRWLTRNGYRQRLNRSAFEQLLGLLLRRESHKLSLGEKGFLIVEAGVVRLAPRSSKNKWDTAYALAPPVSLHFPWGASLSIARRPLDERQRGMVLNGQVDPETEAWLSAENIRGAVTVESWQEGDRYTPLGAPGTVKLQDAFVSRKIPVEERKRLPVVRYFDDILWCPGLLPAHNYRITADTMTALQLTYHRASAV